MKKKIILPIVLLLVLLAAGIIWLIKDKNILEYVERNAANRQETWCEDYKVISHALGGIDGIDYTNSYEALEFSYEKGQRVVEADFLFTSDGALVLRHYWEDDLGQENFDGSAPTLEEFKAMPIFSVYTPMTAEELAAYMSSHGDLYLVTDVKHKMKSTTFEDTMKEFVKIAKETDASILKRVIVQIYCEDDYKKMEKIYPFESYIFTLYKLPKEYKDQYGKIAEFCKKNGISVVTMPAKWVKEKSDIEELTGNDIKVYVHTVNEYEEAVKLLEMGVSGIYTDYLYESDFQDMDVDEQN
ncbi:MAG: hypothetical protein HDR01_00725 [Lachnospiraceae bacterium]|nr:hypothetical protein [Lachnospiraceae bacterium]